MTTPADQCVPALDPGHDVVTQAWRYGRVSNVSNQLLAKPVADASVSEWWRPIDRGAFADVRVQRVTAETPTDSRASLGLLEKCGFLRVGLRIDPEDGEPAVYEIGRS